MIDLETLDNAHIEAALREWKRLGREAFRDQFGITGKARRFFIVYAGEDADLKAIMTAAAMVAGQRQPKSNDIHSHRAHARAQALGFDVKPKTLKGESA